MNEQRRPAATTGTAAQPGSLAQAVLRRSTDVLSLGSFVVLGLPDGMLGTAWPAMRQTFGVPVGDLGLILLAVTAGASVVTAFVGVLIRRLGVPALLATSGGCAAIGAAGFSLAPGFWALLLVAILSGAAAGMMDGGMNTAVALAGRGRLLNLLHGAYGVGTAIGPLLVTAAIVTGSWRPAYLALLILDLVIGASWLRQRRRTGPPPTAAEQAAAQPPDQTRSWSRRRYRWTVFLGMAVFFLYTGLEVGAGQWEASFCRGHLGLDASAAGLASFGYWGCLTAVRISLALLPRPLSNSAIISGGSLIAVAAAALIWWQPSTVACVLGFVLLGGSLAGIFPAMIALTPARIGEHQAQHVIAWQVGAAAARGAGISALIGLLIAATSLAILGSTLTAAALLFLLGQFALARLAPPRT